jgi:hypothetical protein
MAATIHNPYIEQGVPWAIGIETDLDLKGLSGRAWLRSCLNGANVATPAVTVPAVTGMRIDVELTAAQTMAIPACGKMFNELESYDFLVELYDPLDPNRIYRLVNGVARVSPRGRQP